MPRALPSSPRSSTGSPDRPPSPDTTNRESPGQGDVVSMRNRSALVLGYMCTSLTCAYPFPDRVKWTSSQVTGVMVWSLSGTKPLRTL
jgi:hypothetical protein